MTISAARPAILLIATALALTACAPPAPVGDQRITQLLTAHLTLHCDPRTLTVRSASSSPAEVQRAEHAFKTAVLENTHYPSVADSMTSSEIAGTVIDTENGRALRVNWSMYDAPDTDSRNRLTISGCLYVPGTIEIMDRAFSPGGRRAQVTFQATYRLTRLGAKLRKLEILHDRREPESSGTYSYVALLTQNTAGNWAVRTMLAK